MKNADKYKIKVKEQKLPHIGDINFVCYTKNVQSCAKKIESRIAIENMFVPVYDKSSRNHIEAEKNKPLLVIPGRCK